MLLPPEWMSNNLIVDLPEKHSILVPSSMWLISMISRGLIMFKDRALEVDIATSYQVQPGVEVTTETMKEVAIQGIFIQ